MPSQHRIFIVDDEPVIALTLRAIFQNAKYDAHYFTVALAAQLAAETMPPDLLLTDFSLGEVDGIALAESIRAINPMCEVNF